MDNQKQIEEIAKVMSDGCRGIADCSDTDIITCDECRAAILYNSGYRKIPENAVVLTREEYEKLRFLADECIDWRIKNCNVDEIAEVD